ncbi:malonyl-ACP O-methyltransferase BioC [Marinobacterium jannaschii]|uniref:malonyl-ACP O-methyltransferase BioC n=1 Tax=Marinobacterium jannaschii TaxID=64970 RepID=UPI00048668DB|nr:malonyl-ACP O-methyltransferase BioC [Marinobacterium jannaschii]
MSPAQFDKQRVAASFSRAASSYDSVAQLQRDVGNAALEQLPQLQPQRVVDLGSGTGYFSERLQQQFPQSTLISLDLAEGMLRYAREHRPLRDGHYLCADAESLPLADNSVELIFSSLAIQWCSDYPKLFAEIGRVLKPGGCFLFATLGPQTLHELRQAWAAVDGYVHVNSFTPADELKQALPDVLALERWQEEDRLLRYGQLKQLTDELKGIGAHNMNQGQQHALTGRQRIIGFKNAYEQQRMVDGSLPATYEVFYGLLRKKNHG